MCVIIHQPQGSSIPFSHLRRGNETNPHGWGVAAKHPDGSISISRGFSSNSLVAAYKRVAHLEVVVHCRIGTGGTITLQNTHPFRITDDTVMFHNGIFRDIDRTSDPSRPDTYHLAQTLRPVFLNDPVVLNDERFIARLEEYCRKGYSNKLVFMSSINPTVIINEQAGTKRGEVWYSNCSAFAPAIVESSLQDDKEFEDWLEKRWAKEMEEDTPPDVLLPHEVEHFAKSLQSKRKTSRKKTSSKKVAPSSNESKKPYFIQDPKGSGLIILKGRSR